MRRSPAVTEIRSKVPTGAVGVLGSVIGVLVVVGRSPVSIATRERPRGALVTCGSCLGSGRASGRGPRGAVG
ncbi:hypothetical protein CUD01_30700 [Cellulomonas uda]|uniref:Uncharacterized protein n=1 Tax=Cellulomonas uda TaxID=1714 RepID=A0A4Y3KG22_CELUD|nr:hypothetical protein CUD01_30700 [Cellulomonas uda]